MIIQLSAVPKADKSIIIAVMCKSLTKTVEFPLNVVSLIILGHLLFVFFPFFMNSDITLMSGPLHPCACMNNMCPAWSYCKLTQTRLFLFHAFLQMYSTYI